MARADNSKPRGGGGGGGGGSDVGARHHSPSGDSGGSVQVQPSRSNDGGGSSRSEAERRHPRAGTGTGNRHFGRGGRSYSYYPGYYYFPGYYPGYYSGYSYGYWPYFGGGAYFGLGGYYGSPYYGPYHGYRSYRDRDSGAVRVLVDPEDAKVYVDGYYAGKADDFDGLFQRLYVAPGRHELTFKKAGYRTHKMKVYVGPDATVKVHHDMEKGDGPETMEDLAGDRGLRDEPRDGDRYVDRDRDRRDDDNDDDRPDGEERDLRESSGVAGLLALDVTPSDASVYVDGRFRGSARQTGELELRPGVHRVEVVRPGYRTVNREVVVESGKTQTVRIELGRPEY